MTENIGGRLELAVCYGPVIMECSDSGRAGVGKVLESFVYEGEWSVGARAPTELLEDDLVGYREAVEA